MVLDIVPSELVLELACEANGCKETFRQVANDAGYLRALPAQQGWLVRYVQLPERTTGRTVVLCPMHSAGAPRNAT